MTVHARGGPKSIAQTQPYITLPLPHRPNLQSQTGHNKNIQTRKDHETPSAKCYKFFHSCFLLFHEGKTSEERGEKHGMYVVNYSSTWWKWLCFKCWGERRETAVKHIWSIFHFQGSDCLPKGTTTHKHTRRTIEIGLFSLLYSFFKDLRREIRELLFDVVILLQLPANTASLLVLLLSVMRGKSVKGPSCCLQEHCLG